MIIVRLMGGLGNQMFQYAAGRTLACRHQTVLKLDTAFLSKKHDDCTPRHLELHNLNVQLELATSREVAAFSGEGLRALFPRMAPVLERIGFRLLRGKSFREETLHYEPRCAELPDNVLLVGYWQSARYFTPIGDILREEFRVTSPLDGANRALLARIASGDSVAVHVRRGDYLTNPAAVRHHGTSGMEYYRKAVDLLLGLVPQPAFFVFSDDPEWTRTHLTFIPGAQFVSCKGSDRCSDDLRLMAACRHHIIANSSFSWWGAWLGGHAGKVVIAPASWYLQDTIDTTHLCPPSWFRI